MPDEAGSIFWFYGDAEAFVDRVRDLDELSRLYEVLHPIAENPEIDFEHIREYPTEDMILKICHSTEFVVVCIDRLDGTIQVYDIRRRGP